MILWSTIFNTLGPYTRLPRLLCISSETQSASSYHLEGRLRTREKHVLFKYTLSGTGTFRDAKGEHPVPPEHGFLCEVGNPEIAYYYPDAATQPWTFVFIIFEGDCAIQWARDLIKQSGPVFHLPRESGAIEHLVSFGKDNQQHRVIQAAWGAELVLSLLLALTRSRERGSTSLEPDGLVRRVQELVANHLDQDLNGKELAARLRISREHLSRAFRHATGMTLHAFILQQKMDYASYLLKHSEFNVKEIAAHLGYDSPAHFGRTFRRIKNMTPGDFKTLGQLH